MYKKVFLLLKIIIKEYYPYPILYYQTNCFTIGLYFYIIKFNIRATHFKFLFF